MNDVPKKGRLIIYALMALHYHSKKEISGATYAGLQLLTGNKRRTTMRRAIQDCIAAGLVSVTYGRYKRVSVTLTPKALKEMDSFMRQAGDSIEYLG